MLSWLLAADVDSTFWKAVSDQGLAIVITIGVFLGVCWVGKKLVYLMFGAFDRVFGNGGYADRLTEGHLRCMDRITVGQEELNNRVDTHCTEEEVSMRKMRRGAVKCIEAALSSSEELGISEKSRIKLVEAKAEFQNGEVEK